MRVVISAALSAAMFYLSQGLDDAWALAWLAPAPLLWLAFGETPPWRLFAASFVAFLAGEIYDLQCYAEDLPLGLLALLMGLQAILFAFAVLFARFVRRRLNPFAALLALPACWTAVEYLVSLVSPHGSFGSIAYSQMSAPLLIQSASLFGMYSITFLICLFASALALAARPGRGALAAAGAALVLCALDVAFGAARLSAPQPASQPKLLRVAALDDVAARTRTRGTDTAQASLAAALAYAADVRQAAGQGARLVVTPEGGLAVRGAWLAAATAPLAEASGQTGAQVVAGIYERAPAGDIAIAFAPDGSRRVYAKRHLLLPLEAEFTPGAGPGLLGAGLAVAICKDMDFPRTLRHDSLTAPEPIRLMAVPAGDFVADGWLHARMAILRGVENGFAVVRAAHRGLLTVSDAQGRLIAWKGEGPHGLDVIAADVPLGPGPTLYTRIGDVLPWASLALTLCLGAGAGLRRRSDRGARTVQAGPRPG